MKDIIFLMCLSFVAILFARFLGIDPEHGAIFAVLGAIFARQK